MPVTVLGSRDIVENSNKVPASSEFRVLLVPALMGIDLRSDTVHPHTGALLGTVLFIWDLKDPWVGKGNSSCKPDPEAAMCLIKELPTLPKNLANKWIFIKLSSF